MSEARLKKGGEGGGVVWGIMTALQYDYTAHIPRAIYWPFRTMVLFFWVGVFALWGFLDIRNPLTPTTSSFLRASLMTATAPSLPLLRTCS